MATGNGQVKTWKDRGHLERLDDLIGPAPQSSLNISYRQKQRKMPSGFTKRGWGGRMMNPIGIIVNDSRLKNGPRLTNSLRTSHALVGSLGPKRERKSIKQKKKWFVFLRQRFRSSSLPTQLRRRKTRRHTTILSISEPLNQKMRHNPFCQK